jgi:hypothetical protein
MDTIDAIAKQLSSTSADWEERMLAMKTVQRLLEQHTGGFGGFLVLAKPLSVQVLSKQQREQTSNKFEFKKRRSLHGLRLSCRLYCGVEVFPN